MILSKELSEEQYAHTLEGRPPDEWEPLAAHLSKVADSASNFARAFGAEYWGEILGRCHDLGKRSDKFQLHLRNAGQASVDAGAESEDAPGKRVDHSTYGARFVAETVGRVPVSRAA